MNRAEHKLKKLLGIKRKVGHEFGLYRGQTRFFWKRPRPDKKAIGKQRALRTALIKEIAAALKTFLGSAITTKNEDGTYTHTFKLNREE